MCVLMHVHSGVSVTDESKQAAPENLYPSGEPGVSGDFWGSQEGCQGPFRPSGRRDASQLHSIPDFSEAP